MRVGLNIKNEHVHDLARRAAQVTGKTQTGAIQEALERLLAEHGDPESARQARLDELWQEITVNTTDADRAATRAVLADLYDDAGLPR